MQLHLHRRPALRAAVTATALALTVAGIAAGSTQAAASRGDRSGLSVSDQHPTLTSRTTAGKSASSRLAQTPKSLLRATGSAPVGVMIKFDYDAVASYTGSVPGYAATSPSVTGTSLSKRPAAASDYLGYVASRERTISRAITAAVPAAQVTRSYRTVYGGVSARIPANSVQKILSVPGVIAVQRDAIRQPLTDSSSEFINATAAYSKLETTANAGEGILLGNLDTGVWPEHPLFADQGNLPAYDGPVLPCNFGDNPLTPAPDVFECNDKLVGGQAFMDTHDFYTSSEYLYEGTARDSEGHGSHTASTSAGNVLENVQTMGPELAKINGMAPGAQIMEYRVCGPDGCYSSDTTAAVEQAILDGVNAINFSISGGTDPMTDPTELAFLDAYNANVFVSASAGNSGPSAATANHLAPWVTTVAASTQQREFASTLTLQSGEDTYTVDGSTITAGAGPLPVVNAADAPYSDAKCLTPAADGTFAGQIVVCTRGTNARVEKGYNVLQGDAAGMILVNPVLADTETDNHWLPAIHIADGTDLLAYMDSHTDVTGTFTDGAPRDGQGDVMAAFSSRGPAGSFIKPDITAPGVQILAAMTPTPEDPANGPSGEYYQAIAGTSMSSPHIAGVAILLQAVHPNWSPGQIKSAMMTQAVTKVVKEDLTTPADPFDMGGGRINVGRAMKAPLTISESGEDFAAMTGDPLHAIDLNIPSINAPTMPGRITTDRTVKNVSGQKLVVTPSAAVPAGTKITFSPSSRTIKPGNSGTFTITLTSKAPVGEQQFGAIKFNTKAGSARIPVAFVPQQGSVSLLQDCDKAAVDKGGKTTCTVTATNNSFEAEDVTATTRVNDKLTITKAVGATLKNGKAKASAVLAGSVLGVPSVDDGSSPAGGFLDLADFGVPAMAIGDEEIIDFDVPAFVYNGQTLDAIGVDSNGYLVAGGSAGSSDNQCCDLPGEASPAPPNNVLAPFWTDLDGTAAPGIRAEILGDGTNNWLVVQWEVNVYGTADLRKFQTWIGINGTQDISFTYAQAMADPNQPYQMGAENAAGAGDITVYLPEIDQVVTSTDPTPGDSLTYDVVVKGIKAGMGNVHTDMVTDAVRGVTTADTPVKVRR